MNLLEDVITYVRRIIKSPSDAVISDNLIIDYINRFWIMDVDARLQLFDLKTTYQFQLVPGIDQYNMPLYDVQTEGTGTGSSNINFYPVYQGFSPMCRVNGYNVQFFTQRSLFFNYWPNWVQQSNAVAFGDGGSTYTIQLPFSPSTQPVVNVVQTGLLRGHVDMAGIIATGVNQDPPLTTGGPSSNFQTIPVTSTFPAIYITTTDGTGANAIIADSGQFLEGSVNYGLLMRPGNAPTGNVPLNGGYSTAINTINYNTGTATFNFTDSAGAALNIPTGQQINAQFYMFNPGLPKTVLFYNNTLTFRTVPDQQYLVELEAYLTPGAFLNSSSAIPFAYMAEYIARGAARKMLSDTGDTEQFNFYEPLFREQEILVWKRSQRQWTSTRTQTIFSQGNMGSGQSGYNSTMGSV